MSLLINCDFLANGDGICM
ncbi:hypothetical protein BpHYR1_001422 [Brachionus plicatilis]|uniref:Uncharacterized protein n=1 Tax=Brachionus plicatilis TaxID=10195 RepID=A0A3M7Q3I1_BRAPC|nr:hypothetical protein BpHYR1_001422 [Brachionus plicatilis]